MAKAQWIATASDGQVMYDGRHQEVQRFVVYATLDRDPTRTINVTLTREQVYSLIFSARQVLKGWPES